MGKERRQRNKFHLSSTPSVENTKKQSDVILETNEPSKNPEPLLPPAFEFPTNVFEGMDIDITSLKKELKDDVVSVKSFKTAKSETEKVKRISKKDKIQMRRDKFLQKLNRAYDLEKQKKMKKKKATSTSLIGNTQDLFDALPSLEPLMQYKGKIDLSAGVKTKNQKKGIEKASKQKRNTLKGIQMYRQTLKNVEFCKNPLEAFSAHVKSIVNYQKKN